MPGVTAFILFFLGLRLDPALEKSQPYPEGVTESCCSTRVGGGFFNSFRQLFAALYIKPVRDIILFMMFTKLLRPSFGTFGYYFYTE